VTLTWIVLKTAGKKRRCSERGPSLLKPVVAKKAKKNQCQRGKPLIGVPQSSGGETGKGEKRKTTNIQNGLKFPVREHRERRTGIWKSVREGAPKALSDRNRKKGGRFGTVRKDITQ